MTQLVKGFTNEELWQKAEYEGIEYLFLDYLDPDHIIDEDAVSFCETRSAIVISTFVFN